MDPWTYRNSLRLPAIIIEHDDDDDDDDMCRFINARRRIVQPMIDQTNRAGMTRIFREFQRSPEIIISQLQMQHRSNTMQQPVKTFNEY